MNISRLIKQLEKVLETKGDLEVGCYRAYGGYKPVETLEMSEPQRDDAFDREVEEFIKLS